MNRTSRRALPKLSSLVINLRQSLFDIESLLNLSPRILSKLTTFRTGPVTRWNE